MNLSIFNFEPPALGETGGPAGDAAWRRFSRLAMLCAVGVALGIYLLLVIADPYDTGRFFRWPIGISDASPRTANASRGSDPRFNAAVIGNSRGQLLDPARLSALTGRSFVQLTAVGTQPREQLAVLHWFKRHHTDSAAIVLVMDEGWCTSDPALPVSFPFPFWLYADDNIDYLKSVMRAQAFDRLWRRVRVALHLTVASDPAGYANYDLLPGANVHPPGLDDPAPMVIGRVADAPLPALDRLRDELMRLPPDAPVVIVMPPVYRAFLPKPESPQATRLAACKAAFAALAASRAHGAFIDFLVDGAIARDPDNFRDEVHYHSNVAQAIERSIAKAITGG